MHNTLYNVHINNPHLNLLINHHRYKKITISLTSLTYYNCLFNFNTYSGINFVCCRRVTESLKCRA